ncbi:glycosyltransferase [Micrococcus sp.]|uniref:glycosyltransferase n=1 Tax=Micrococcus sp. TaxID=1271 RepID=UPI002A91FDA4|nr:glycosyltransferase [Micrococcus sp.]MDY6055687.1 glycosyltransferase [Micrococcus sp.]
MRILISLDQPADSLGGAQQSAVLQAEELARAGHEVLFLAPGPHPGPHAAATVPIPGVGLPGQEYRTGSLTRRAARRVSRQIDARGGVDLVHVQGDYWGAAHALFHARHRGLPVVVTFHNNLAVGLAAVLGPAARLGVPAVTAAVSGAMDHVLGVRRRPALDPWRHLGRIAEQARQVVAPSAHFAADLRAHGVAEEVTVVANGVADRVLDGIGAVPLAERTTFVWSGRLSAEKRPLEFLEAVAAMREPAAVDLYGDGPLREQVAAAVRRLGLEHRVRLRGRVPYEGMLTAIAGAHALVQTSVGFETQGMTVAEAVALGTPVVVCDERIAAELPASARVWQAPERGAQALAAVLDDAAGATAGEHGVRAPGTAFRQSTQTAAMLEVYDAACRATRH